MGWLSCIGIKLQAMHMCAIDYVNVRTTAVSFTFLYSFYFNASLESKKKKKSSDLIDSLVRPISDCDDGEISMPDINKWNYYDKGVLGIPTNTTVMFFSN